jgi:hypothetical protein
MPNFYTFKWLDYSIQGQGNAATVDAFISISTVNRHLNNRQETTLSIQAVLGTSPSTQHS